MRLAAVGAVAALVAAACGSGDKPMSGGAQHSQTPALAEISDSEWAGLAARRIFFGHQSVGQNIMEGMAAVLASHPGIRLRVVDTKNVEAMSEPGFYHGTIGRNGFPSEKEAEFARIVDSAFADGRGVVMMKFCYLDVQAATDPVAMFQGYRRRMTELAERLPGVRLVHVTLPLTVAESPVRYWLKRLLGRPTLRDVDVIRNRYNALLLAAYTGREPVFDLAALESMRPDGSRSFFTRGGDTVFTLADANTTDGGHLNPAASRRIAERLLALLAKLPAS